MSIAWRYRKSGQVNTEVGSQPSGGLGRDFDVSKSVTPEQLAGTSVLAIDLRTCCRDGDPATDVLCGIADLLPAHAAVLTEVTAWLKEFAVERPTASGEQRKVARVVVESLGSPLWPSVGPELVSTVRLLHRLRAMVRQSFAVLLVTMPCATVAPDVLRRTVHLSDTAVRLEAFAGTPNENSSVLKDYHGFVHVLKLPRLNTLTCFYPDTLDLAFKLRRKKFVIERIHLPPDMSETVSRTQGAAPKHAAAAASSSATRGGPAPEW
jgi:elongator complex protein 4